MTACTHRLDNDPTGLLCTLADGHAPGCVFTASAGPDLGAGDEQ